MEPIQDQAILALLERVADLDRKLKGVQRERDEALAILGARIMNAVYTTTTTIQQSVDASSAPK